MYVAGDVYSVRSNYRLVLVLLKRFMPVLSLCLSIFSLSVSPFSLSLLSVQVIRSVTRYCSSFVIMKFSLLAGAAAIGSALAVDPITIKVCFLPTSLSPV